MRCKNYDASYNRFLWETITVKSKDENVAIDEPVKDF